MAKKSILLLLSYVISGAYSYVYQTSRIETTAVVKFDVLVNGTKQNCGHVEATGQLLILNVSMYFNGYTSTSSFASDMFMTVSEVDETYNTLSCFQFGGNVQLSFLLCMYVCMYACISQSASASQLKCCHVL